MVFSYHGGRRWQYHYRGKRTADDQGKVDGLKELGGTAIHREVKTSVERGDGDFTESSWCDVMACEKLLQND